MKKIFLLLLFLTIPYSLIPSPSLAQSKILINEFLIDPQPQSVEIFNSGTESTDISDWVIDDSGGTTFYTIPKGNIIFPNQCLVFSGDFNLNKTSVDTIKLINGSQELIDFFSYKSSSGSGISYLRFPDGSINWATSSVNLGFYNSSREQTCLLPTLTPSPTLEPTLTLTPIVPTSTPTPITSPVVASDATEVGTSYNNIYLSEVMINPVSGEKEWVEIYNDNDFSVALNDWHIDDLENSGSSPKIFSLEINAKNYTVFNLTSSIFNNDKDSVRLLDFNKNTKDDFEYQKTEQGKTLGRTTFSSDDFCIQEPSKNSVNNLCINLSPTPITSPVVASDATEAGSTPSIIIETKIPINPINKGLINQTPTSLNNSYPVSPDVLGVSSKLTIDPPSNKSLINLLTILSSSYSLLTITSILFKMKLSYGKGKKFYSSSICPA